MSFNDITHSDICHWLARAKVLFLQHDHDLLDNNVNERSMTHRFAVHLGHARPEHLDERFVVDCEYNRINGVPKSIHTLYGAVSPSASDAKTVYPDIIVHRRGTSDNLMIIEAKKSSADTSDDRKKLKAYQEDKKLRYRFAVMLIFETGPEQSIRYGISARGDCEDEQCC